MSIIDKHLEGITIANMQEVKKEAFMLYASARGVKIGFVADNKYQVRAGRNLYTYDHAKSAIDKYKELVKE